MNHGFHRIGFVAFALLFVGQYQADAAIFDSNDLSLPSYQSADGMNITTDTLTGLDWLDVTTTTNISYDDMTEMLGVGELAGFRYAWASEVSNFFFHLGLPTEVKLPGVSGISFDSGRIAALDAASHTGATTRFGGNRDAEALGLTGSITRHLGLVYGAFYESRDDPQNILSSGLKTIAVNQVSDRMGSWLVRPTGGVVPDPTRIFVPDGLRAGDRYRLVFTTQGSRNAWSTDIADYNAFVNEQAVLEGAVTRDWDLEWKAIASTATVGAATNISIDDAPVYRLNGWKLDSELWRSDFFRLSFDQFGQNYWGAAWTGTDNNGMPSESRNSRGPLGDPSGRASASHFNGVSIDYDFGVTAQSLPLHAISPLLTVPESYSPSTAVALVLNGSGDTFFERFYHLSELATIRLREQWQVMLDDQPALSHSGLIAPFVEDEIYAASDHGTADASTFERSLGIGVADGSLTHEIELNFEVSNQPARAIRLQFDVKAWQANPDADSPGEAAFHATLNVGDNMLVDFGTTTTGTVLTPGLLNGNESPNRVSYDSGIIEVSIPINAPAQINWTVPEGSATNGWMFGLDNVMLRTVAPGDVDANGFVDVEDLITLLAGQKFNQGVDGVTWEQGDFNGDDQFDTGDLLTMLAFLSGTFPSKLYASEAGGTTDAVADVIVNSETGEITIDLAGHTVSAIIIESAAEIFNGAQPQWDTTSQFPSSLPGELGNVLFTATASGTDELGVVISDEFLGRDKEFYLQDLDFSVMVASDGGALTKGNVIVVPEPSSVLLLSLGGLAFMFLVQCRNTSPQAAERIFN